MCVKHVPDNIYWYVLIVSCLLTVINYQGDNERGEQNNGFVADHKAGDYVVHDLHYNSVYHSMVRTSVTCYIPVCTMYDTDTYWYPVRMIPGAFYASFSGTETTGITIRDYLLLLLLGMHTFYKY